MPIRQVIARFEFGRMFGRAPGLLLRLIYQLGPFPVFPMLEVELLSCRLGGFVGLLAVGLGLFHLLLPEADLPFHL